MNAKILAIDLGFGSTKVCYFNELKGLQFESHVTALGKVSHSNHFNDANAFEFSGEYYYVFEPAVKLNPEHHLDILSYKGFRTASPIIIRYLLKKLEIEPELIVIGISLAMMEYSQDYKDYLVESLLIDPSRIKLVPQGVGAKVALDAYKLTPYDPASSNIQLQNYLGVDIGFNTVDVFKVIQGSVSTQTTQGLEGEGVVKISKSLAESIEGLDLQTAKTVITTKVHKLRGDTINVEVEVAKAVKSYLTNLLKLIESNYSTDLNKLDNIIFVGGGAAIIKTYYESLKEEFDLHFKKDYIVIPEIPEYYNSIGYLLIGTKLLEKL